MLERLAQVDDVAVVPPADPADRLDADLVAQRLDLAGAWLRLSETDQEVMSLTVFDDLSSLQAGGVLGISAASYRLRLLRARCAAPPPRPAATLVRRADGDPAMNLPTDDALRSLDAATTTLTVSEQQRAAATLERIVSTAPSTDGPRPMTPRPARRARRRLLVACILAALALVSGSVLVRGARRWGTGICVLVSHPNSRRRRRPRRGGRCLPRQAARLRERHQPGPSRARARRAPR